MTDARTEHSLRAATQDARAMNDAVERYFLAAAGLETGAETPRPARMAASSSASSPLKRALLGTGAAALTSAVAIAAVSDGFQMRIGGFFESRLAYSGIDAADHTNQMPDYNGVDVKRDAEIHFEPSTTLDNGVRIGARVELEGASGDDQIDESYLWAEGFFGRVLLGSENSARYLMHYAAPDVSLLGANDGDIGDHFPFTEAIGARQTGDAEGTLSATFVENFDNNDAERITWFSPRLAGGFQFGASYARDDAQDDNSQRDLSGERGGDIFDFGLNWVGNTGKIGEIGLPDWFGIGIPGIPAPGGDYDVAASFGYGFALSDRENDPATHYDEGANPKVWNAGLNVGRGPLTVGGSFAEQNDTVNRDGTAWDAGVSYETEGPWSFSFTYFTGENVDNEVSNGMVSQGADENLDMYVLGANYALAQGIDLNGFAAYAAFEEDFGDGGGRGDDLDGFVVGTGVRIEF